PQIRGRFGGRSGHDFRRRRDVAGPWRDMSGDRDGGEPRARRRQADSECRRRREWPTGGRSAVSVSTAVDGIKDVRTPLSDADVRALKAGDRVPISALIYTP